MKVSFILFANLFQASQAFTFQLSKNNDGIPFRTGYNQILRKPSERRQSQYFGEGALYLSSSVDYVEAENIKSIKSLFSKYADGSDLMTKDTLCTVPPFDDMLVR